MGIETSTIEDDENYVSEDIVLNIFRDLISTVIEKSTLEKEDKYVSYKSHLSTVLQGPKLSKKKKRVSKKKELKLTETATKFRLVQQKNIPTNTTKNQKDDKCDRNYHS